MNKLIQEALDLYTVYRSYAKASEISGIPATTLKDRVKRARVAELMPSAILSDSGLDETIKLKAQITSLKADLRSAQKQQLSVDDVKTKILMVRDMPQVVPEWTVAPPEEESHGKPGVPVAFWSDWHWAEVIERSQIGGVDNEYNLAIAHRRAKVLLENTIDILRNHTTNPDYPGLVLVLGGDFFSGNIHDELMISNEVPIMKAIIDLQGVLVYLIKELHKEFGNIFIAGVTGNHSRTTHKVPAKNRAYENFDWLLYQNIKMQLEEYADNITFLLPDGPDAYFKVYNHRFLLSHGDQFRGGDSAIGCLGPIMRGDLKKRTKQMQIGDDYDTMLNGHFHQFMFNGRVLVNGSLCGYNEYCHSMNFPVEEPKQSLFFVHPDHGITFHMPVHVGEKQQKKETAWVSVPK